MAKESQAARRARKALDKRIAHRAAGDSMARLADVWTKRKNHRPGFAWKSKNAKPALATVTKGVQQ